MLSPMSLATEYCVAHRTLAPAVLFAGTGNLPNATLPGIDPTRLARLFAILSKHGRPYGGPSKCKLLTDAALDHCVLLVAPKMVALLPNAEPVSGRVAKEWADTSHTTASSWDRSSGAPALTLDVAARALGSLIGLARVARSTRSDLLLRLSLPRAT
jgi:hypothetical protein